MKPKKQFDCLEMKAEIQKNILQETSNMDTQALLQYFNAGIPAAYANPSPRKPVLPPVSGR